MILERAAVSSEQRVARAQVDEPCRQEMVASATLGLLQTVVDGSKGSSIECRGICR